MVSSTPAYGYQPPAPYYQRTLETEKGLKHLYWGIMIYIFATLLMFLGVIFTFIFIEDIIAGGQDPDQVTESLGIIFGAAALVCGGGFLYLIMLILWLIGLYEMYQGRNEFGRAHADKVPKAVILIVLYICLLVVSTIVTFALDFNFNLDPDTALERLRLITIISGSVEFIATIFLGFAVVYLVFELSDENYQRMLWISFAVLLVVTLVSRVLSIVLLYGDISGDIEQLGQIEALASLSMAISFIPFLLFLICYRHAYSRVKEGEIQPVAGTFAAAYPAPPGYQQPYYQPPPPTPPPYEQPAKVCPSCGGPTQPGETFCANCGARLQ